MRAFFARIFLLKQARNQNKKPVCGDTGAETADGVAENRLTDEFFAVEAVHHRSVGTQVSAPAHAHCGENCDVAGADEFCVNEAFSKAE